MGSTNTLFGRNVQFEETFPQLGATELTKNRHAGRIALLRPDPQVISRELFTRPQSDSGEVQRRDERSGPERALRLHQGTVLQRARGVLDPVHDARLVLAPRRGRERQDDDGGGMRESARG